MTEPDATREPELRTLQIYVCVNCMDRVPGECHAPGCFFWMRSIDEVPTHLEMHLPPDRHCDACFHTDDVATCEGATERY